MENEQHFEPTAAAPGVSGADVLRYLPLLFKILAAFETGTGTFSTNTPAGRRWIRVSDKPFPDTP